QLGAANALTVYVSTGAGVVNVVPPVAPVVQPPAAITAPAAFNPAAAQPLAYDATRHLLYAGTSAAAAPADAGIDFVQQLATAGGDGPGIVFAGTQAFPGFTAFTSISGLSVNAADGSVVVADDPGAIVGGVAGLAR